MVSNTTTGQLSASLRSSISSTSLSGYNGAEAVCYGRLCAESASSQRASTDASKPLDSSKEGSDVVPTGEQKAHHQFQVNPCGFASASSRFEPVDTLTDTLTLTIPRQRR